MHIYKSYQHVFMIYIIDRNKIVKIDIKNLKNLKELNISMIIIRFQIVTNQVQLVYRMRTYKK